MLSPRPIRIAPRQVLLHIVQIGTETPPGIARQHDSLRGRIDELIGAVPQRPRITASRPLQDQPLPVSGTAQTRLTSTLRGRHTRSVTRNVTGSQHRCSPARPRFGAPRQLGHGSGAPRRGGRGPLEDLFLDSTLVTTCTCGGSRRGRPDEAHPRLRRSHRGDCTATPRSAGPPWQRRSNRGFRSATPITVISNLIGIRDAKRTRFDAIGKGRVFAAPGAERGEGGGAQRAHW